MIIDVETQRSPVADLIFGRYDLALVAGSWDSRSLVFADSDLSVGTTILLGLTPDVYSDLAEGNQRRTLDKANGASGEVVVLSADRRSPMATLSSVVSIVRGESTKVGRPLRAFVDLCGVSRYVSLGLLAAALSDGSVLEIDFSYATAKGYTAPLADMRDGYVFRSGTWLPFAIPGFGSPLIGGRQHLLVSAGFEGRRTRRLIDLLEPDYVTVLESESPVARNNEILRQQIAMLSGAVPSARLNHIQTAVGDVDGISDALRNLGHVHPDVARPPVISMLLAGPKSAALGLAVAALRGRVANVFYVQSENHEEVDVTGVSEYFRYRIGPPWRDAVLGSRG